MAAAGWLSSGALAGGWLQQWLSAGGSGFPGRLWQRARRTPRAAWPSRASSSSAGEYACPLLPAACLVPALLRWLRFPGLLPCPLFIFCCSSLHALKCASSSPTSAFPPSLPAWPCSPGCGLLFSVAFSCLVGRSTELMCPRAGCCCFRRAAASSLALMQAPHSHPLVLSLCFVHSSLLSFLWLLFCWQFWLKVSDDGAP